MKWRFIRGELMKKLEANYFSVLRGIGHKPDYLAAVERLNRNEINPDHLFDLFKDADERILH